MVGVGGAGGNAVNNMIRSNLVGCDFVICNTDAQAMNQNLCESRIQMVVGVTRGLGAGSRPEVGRRSVLREQDDELRTSGDWSEPEVWAKLEGFLALHRQRLLSGPR